MWTFYVVIHLALWCTGLPLTFNQPEVCQNLQLPGDGLSSKDGLSLLFIGESAYMSCNINSGSIPNFSLSSFRLKVKKCDNMMNLKADSVARNGMYAITVQDPIIDLPCPQKYLDYYCYYKIDGEDCLVGRKFIYFEYAPSLVENFTCMVDNWRDMTCTFDMGVIYRQWNETAFNAVNISVKYGIKGMLEAVGEMQIKHSGQYLKLYIPDVFLMQYEIRINISNVARHVYKESCFSFDIKDFVKPAKISSLEISQNATAFSLKWTHSNLQMPKRFRVCYTPEWDPSTHTCQTLNQTELFSLGRKNEYSVVLTKLWPYTTYNITIEVRPLLNGNETGFWSDKEIITRKTAEDVPVDVPKLWPGYFEQAKENSIRIYWQPIAEKDRCGIIKFYRITLIDIVPYGEQENITEIEDIPAETISYVLTVDPEKKYKLKLTQKTSVGYPKIDDAHIVIFPKKLRPVLSDSFNVQGLSKTSVEVQWGPGYIPDSNPELKCILTYHILWCKSSRLKEECIEPIRAMLNTSENVTTYKAVINIEHGHFSDYQFGISVEGGNKAGWFISSGITWYRECLYLKDGVPKTPLSFEVPQDVEQDDGLYMKWTHYSCAESSGKVYSYLISYCPADGSEVKCQGMSRNITVSPSATSYKLKDITRGQKYLVQVRAKMENGQYGPWSKPQKVLYKSLKTVETEKIDVPMVAGIVTAIVGIMLMIIGLCICRKRCKKQSEELSKIDVPTIQFRSNYYSLQTNGVEGGTGESRQPLLNTPKDSGLGGSTVNGNSQNSIDKKSNNSTDGVGHVQQNGHVPKHSTVKEYSENSHSIENSETFGQPNYCGSKETDSDGYSDVEQRSTDYESDEDSSNMHSESKDSNIHKYPSRKKMEVSLSTKHCDAENQDFQSENSIGEDNSNQVDSYCVQGESSAGCV